MNDEYKFKKHTNEVYYRVSIYAHSFKILFGEIKVTLCRGVSHY